MAQHHSITATIRNRSGSGALRAMRREGLVPAVIYGKTEKNQNIKLNARDFASLLRESSSEHILVDIDIEGSKKLAVLQDVQRNPLTGIFVHADFHAVSATEIIHATVPVEVIGDAPGLKLGGIVEILTHELSVSCKAEDLPETITVDVSELGLSDSIHVSDVVLPKGVKCDMEPSVVVVLLAEPKVAVEVDATVAAEPEVLREKKPAETK